MHDVSGRMRSVARSEFEYKRPEEATTAKVFTRSSAVLANSVQKALASVDFAIDAARSHTERSFKARLFGGLAKLASMNVKTPMPQLTSQQRTAIAVHRYEQKFKDKHPDFSAIAKNRAADPESFQVVMDVLQGTSTGNAFSCRADIEAFKNNPSLEAAKYIIDKYIVDPKYDNELGTADSNQGFKDSKPMAVNLYRASYLEFMTRLADASFAIANGREDAKSMLEDVFLLVVNGTSNDFRDIKNTIEGIIKQSKSVSATKSAGQLRV